ncbi:LysM peptidoglycan-binding domain-containing protein [Bacillus sp. CRN 9]|nr:LysM peptidoglycan-binding domain-containing protein [Bacillus sp. CRN 9]
MSSVIMRGKSVQYLIIRMCLLKKKTESMPTEIPNQYMIQQGDTFWSIAKGLKGITVSDNTKANPYVNSKKLQVAQVISLYVDKLFVMQPLNCVNFLPILSSVSQF